MKKKYVMGLAAFALAVSVSFNAAAQEKKTTGEKIEKAAEKVGNKTAEIAVKGGAKVLDQKYKGKMAPDSSDVYIDGRNRKYYINKKGAKVYLKVSQIRNRPIEN